MKLHKNYVNARKEFEDVVSSLCDEDYQERYFLDTVYSKSMPSDMFHYTFEFFFDAWPDLETDTEGYLGLFLVNNAEVTAVKKLIKPMDELLEKYGPLMTGEQALADPLWKDVVAAAKGLKGVIEKSHVEYDE